MPHEITARRQRPRNRRLPIQILEHFGGAPVPAAQGRRRHALLVNLEPLLAAAVAAREVGAAGALVEPDHDGALLVRPLLPEGFYFAACGDGGAEVRGGAAVAHYFAVGDG